MNTSALISQRSCQQLLTATLIIALSLAWPARLFAQAYFGTVTGVLTDASGAVLARANVVLTDQDKGYTFQTTTDGRGRTCSARYRRDCTP